MTLSMTHGDDDVSSAGPGADDAAATKRGKDEAETDFE